MKQIALILLFLLAILSACHRNRDLADAIAAADAVVCTDPDSALAILSRADTTGAPDRLRAHYILLLTKARFKAHIFNPDDSLISTAVNYYGGKGDSLELQSLYYYGVILSNKEKNTDALKYLMTAADLAIELGDDFYRAMAYREQADIYYRNFTHHKRAELAHLAAHYFDLAQKPLYALWERVGEAYSLAKIDSLNKALQLLDYIKNDTLISISPSLKANWLRAYALTKFKNKDYRAVIEALNNIEPSGATNLANDYYMLGRANRNIGRTDLALINLDSLSSKMSSKSDTLAMLHLKALLCEDQGLSQKALKARNEYEQRSVSERDPLIANPPVAVVGDYYEQIALLNERLLKKERTIYALIAIICVVVFFWLILYWHRRTNRLKSQLKLLLDQLEIFDQVKNTLSDSQQSNSILSYLLDEWIKSYGIICSDIFKLPSFLTNKHSASLKNTLVNKGAINLIEIFVNHRYDGLMERFRRLMPNLTEREYQISLLLFAGFSQDAICFLTGFNRKNTFSVAKSRLKKILIDQNNPDLQKYIAYFES